VKDEHEESDIDLDVFEQSKTEQAATADKKWEILPASSMLSLEDADMLFRWRKASVITIVGERNGGKTTLVAQLYEQFLRGAFAQTLFTHSLSLQGFERKSFQSRAEYGAHNPETPRTSAQDGLTFFHIAVSDEASLERTDFLISERAGETYRDVRDRPELAANLIEIRKANTIVLILDGERVAQPRLRAGVFASVRTIARALLDSGGIDPETQIQLVTTKCDLLKGDGAADALEALTTFETHLAALLKNRLPLKTFRIAARDPDGNVAPASGMDLLLRSWILPIPKSNPEEPQLPELESEFDRLLLRGVTHER
jgi:GTPase SAR1 family protein